MIGIDKYTISQIRAISHLSEYLLLFYSPNEIVEVILKEDFLDVFKDKIYSESDIFQLFSDHGFVKQNKATVYKYKKDSTYYTVYILSLMSVVMGISGKKLFKEYDTNKIYGFADILHTQSNEASIDIINKDFKRAEHSKKETI